MHKAHSYDNEAYQKPAAKHYFLANDDGSTPQRHSVIRGISLAYGLYVLLPMALLLVGSVGDSWTNTMLPTGLTTRWYQDLWLDTSFRKAFVTSLVVAFSACAINTVLALPLAYSLYHRSGQAGSWAARLVSAMPVAVPAITLGFGYVMVFNTDWLPWLGSLPLLIAAHIIYTLPYLTNTLLTDLKHMQLDALEDAAATLGASPWAQFAGVVVPNLRHSLISGLVMVAALSVGEFQLSNLLTSFQFRTYPVVLLQAFYGATGFACAATVILLLLAATSALVSSSISYKTRATTRATA